MNLKLIVALGSFVLPALCLLALVLAYAIGVDSGLMGVLGTIAGAAFSLPGRVVASVLPAPKDSEE